MKIGRMILAILAVFGLGVFADEAQVDGVSPRLPTGTEWKEPENLSFGREERRAAFSSFDTLENTLKILP